MVLEDMGWHVNSECVALAGVLHCSRHYLCQGSTEQLLAGEVPVTSFYDPKKILLKNFCSWDSTVQSWWVSF